MSSVGSSALLNRSSLLKLAGDPVVAVAVNLMLLALLPLHPLVVGAMVAITGHVLWRRGWSLGSSPVGLPLVAYYFLAAFTLILSRDGGAALRWAVISAVVGSLFAPAAAASSMSRLRIGRFIVYLASALSLYAVIEVALELPALWGPPPLNGQGEVIVMVNEILVGWGLGRAEVTLVEPLLLSFVLVVALALALHREVLPRRRIPVVLVLLGGIGAAGSRSAAVLVLLLLISSATRSRRARLVLASIGILGALVAAACFVLFRPETVQDIVADPSFAHRLAGLQAAVDLTSSQAWWQTLLGNGYGSILRLFEAGRLQSDGFYAVDNQFAYTFAELGLVGLALLSWMLWRSLRSADGLVRPAVTAGIIMFVIFDVLANASSLGLLAVLFGLIRRPTSSIGPEAPSPHLADLTRHDGDAVAGSQSAQSNPAASDEAKEDQASPVNVRDPRVDRHRGIPDDGGPRSAKRKARGLMARCA